MATSQSSNNKRIPLSLSSDEAQVLQELANSQGITLSSAIRKALATESYIKKEIKSGSKILIQQSDNITREVVFR